MCLILYVMQTGQMAPLDLYVEEVFKRASPGGSGGVKTISNYAPVSRTNPRNVILAIKAVVARDSGGCICLLNNSTFIGQAGDLLWYNHLLGLLIVCFLPGTWKGHLSPQLEIVQGEVPCANAFLFAPVRCSKRS
jgi:hypothetical protein